MTVIHMLNAAMDSPWWDLWLLAFIPWAYVLVKELRRTDEQ